MHDAITHTTANPATGERVRWHVSAHQTAGRLVRAELWCAPGGGVRTSHVHDHAEERFEVLAGRMAVELDGRRITGRPGDALVVPAGVPHRWWVEGDEELHVFLEVEPPGGFEEQIETVFALGRAGELRPDGQASLLAAACLMADHPGEIRLASPPAPVQRVLVAALAAVARLTGARATVDAARAEARARLAARDAGAPPPADGPGPTGSASGARRLRRVVVAAALVVLAAALLPVTGMASTASLEGGTLVVRAAPGEKNWMTVGPADEPGRVRITDLATPTADPSVCTPVEYSSTATICTAGPGGVRFEAGDREDVINVGEVPAAVAVVADAGPGADTLRGAAQVATAATLLGGDGDDRVEGGMGPETLDGGPGNDELSDYGGADVMRGGDGNDELSPDYREEQATDVVDGGAGYDQIELGWQSSPGKAQPPIDVSLDGAANDGRPGEGDDVRSIERIYLTAPARLTGSDDADELTIFNSDAGSTLTGRGGDDKLSGFDLADTVDGGAGNDTLEGGYGDDTITGGPGRDTIHADASGTSCHWIQCRAPYGNDTVDVRDGEADSVDCGIGMDTVTADPTDTLANCETVTGRTAGPTPSPSPAPRPRPAPVPGDEGTTTDGRGRVSGLRARRRGGAVVVSGRASGARTVVVTATTRSGRRVGRATARVRDGRFTARLRVRRTAGLRVTVSAAGTTRTLRVR